MVAKMRFTYALTKGGGRAEEKVSFFPENKKQNKNEFFKNNFSFLSPKILLHSEYGKRSNTNAQRK